MADSDVEVDIIAAPTTPKKGGRRGAVASKVLKPLVAAKAKKVTHVATHPTAYKMVIEAVTALNERGGSSLQAIKKHIAGFYSVDSEKLARFIRQAVKKHVEEGQLTQTKGVGASGSFKLTVKTKEVKSKITTAKAAPKKVAAAKKSKAKKPASPKSKKAAPKKAKAVAVPASPGKAAATAKPAAVKKVAAKKAPKAKAPKTLKAPASVQPAAKRAAPKQR